MTLTQALAKLQAAGRIKSRWLPGMLFIDSIGRTARRTGFNPPESPLVGHRTMEASQAQPCLTDAATIGCLLALLREATGDPCVTVSVLQATDGSAVEWSVDSGLKLLRRVTGQAPPWWAGVELFTLHATEGEALAGALVALAEAL